MFIWPLRTPFFFPFYFFTGEIAFIHFQNDLHTITLRIFKELCKMNASLLSNAIVKVT